MKTTKHLAVALSMLLFVACKQDGEYVDLNSGETVEVEKDEETGWMVNTASKKPVYLYVNTSSGDTIYGRTGKVVNTQIAKRGDGGFEYDGDGEYKYVNGDYKKKIDDDGSYKVKDGDYKMKVDEDGSYKIKDGDYKKKVDEDGNIKIKDGDKKIKIEND